MKFILGTKVNMTQIFDDKGIVHPVTVLQSGPMVVTAVKTVATDGYNAVQIGFGEKAEKNINKPEKGHMKKSGLNQSNGLVGRTSQGEVLGNFRFLREFRTEGDPSTRAELGTGQDQLKVGDVIDVSVFKAGEMVTVSGTSKGKGFQGVVKRHGFKGGPRSHGQKHSEREPGSIGGAGRDGGRVAKGKRMAGRMGGDRITTKNLTVVSVKPETGEIFIRGAIAGRKGTLVEVVG